jgi:cytochrome c-type biogenesis protein CcmH/NrfF
MIQRIAGSSRALLFSAAMLAVPVALAGQAANELPPDGEGPSARHPAAQGAIDQLKSPYCPGLMLEVCPSPGGAALRDSLQEMALQGASADELVDWVVGNHGEHWRAMPKRSGMSLFLAWLVPPLGVLAGLGLVIVALRRMRSSAPRPATREGPLSEAEEARLREALRELDAEEEATFF